MTKTPVDTSTVQAGLGPSYPVHCFSIMGVVKFAQVVKTKFAQGIGRTFDRNGSILNKPFYATKTNYSPKCRK